MVSQIRVCLFQRISHGLSLSCDPKLALKQIIDEADRMIDSMHHFWLNQVTKAVYRSGSGPEAVSIFKRTEPAFVTAARWVSLSPEPSRATQTEKQCLFT